jgi:very-short-patch-repair endonuclease
MAEVFKRTCVLSPESRKAISDKLKGHLVPKEVRSKLAAASLKQWKACSATEKVTFMKHMRRAAAVRETSIERSVQTCLTDLKIPFSIHKRIGPYIVDIYLDAHKAVIECDGDYWHGTPSAKVHDAKRDAWMTRRRLTVVRLKEKDIRKNVLRCTRAALRKFIPNALAVNRK